MFLLRSRENFSTDTMEDRSIPVTQPSITASTIDTIVFSLGVWKPGG